LQQVPGEGAMAKLFPGVTARGYFADAIHNFNEQIHEACLMQCPKERIFASWSAMASSCPARSTWAHRG